MVLSARELIESDIENIVDYFLNADTDFLRHMGADRQKLPERRPWIHLIQGEYGKPYEEKEFYYIIWLLDGQPVGHSNINNIQFGKSATMHLHLWDNDSRRKGLAAEFLKLSIQYYFKNFRLQKLICEIRAENTAPLKVLTKNGFHLKRTYDTTPGWINFLQTVNRYELAKEN
jgi:RimJ/RimL family protein N-acetyltransferase